MYKIIKGKEGANVNNIVLHQATEEELKYLFDLGHPFIKKVAKKPKSKDEKTDK
jgi:hypothetical protein